MQLSVFESTHKLPTPGTDKYAMSIFCQECLVARHDEPTSVRMMAYIKNNIFPLISTMILSKALLFYPNWDIYVCVIRPKNMHTIRDLLSFVVVP